MHIHVVLILCYLFSLAVCDYQGDALDDMKSKLNAQANQLSDWNPNQVNPCTWSSVICDKDNIVTRVTLSSMGFTGTLSPKIGVLTHLTLLSLPGNKIMGKIPSSFGNLTSLTSLILKNNLLTGEIPSSLGNLPNLKILDLSQNNLTGTIPQSFSNLSNLNDLGLAFNDLSGPIPDSLVTVSRYNFTGTNLNCGVNYPYTCVSNISEPGGSHKSNVGLILGIIGGILGIFLASLFNAITS